jgi:modification methylase
MVGTATPLKPTVVSPPTAPAPVPQATEAVRVYGHSCEGMPELADSSVDLIVTSPPYWVSPQDRLLAPALLKDRMDATPADYPALLDLLARCFAECLRVLKPGGICCVNVASTIVKEQFFPLPYHLVSHLESVGFRVKDTIIWRRWRGWDHRGGIVIQNPYPGYYRPNRVHEYVLIFEKPGPPIYRERTEEERQASRIPIDALLFHEINNDIWNILPVQPQSRLRAANGQPHPCPFPEELAHRLITLYSYTNELVLDPFSGSGTTAKIAHLTARRFVGYEVNPAFRALTQARIQERTIDRQRRVCRFVPVETVEKRTRVRSVDGNDGA